MKPFWGIVGSCAFLVLGAVNPASAAWCNVFQVCCKGSGHSSSVSGYNPCCNPCPPVCTTRYVQRCYYQPVTSYQTKSYYEPVTTYRTSYYYEPVTSYRYSSYYDPCTCCYQQVACPTTTYRLRSQCCPVQSWVQRCCSVPVTTYRQCSYWEPVTSCYQPAPVCCPTPCAAPCAPSGYLPQAAPAVTEQRYSPPANVHETPNAPKNGSGSPLYDRYYPPAQVPDKMPPAAGSSRPAPSPSPNPSVKIDRIVALPDSSVQGQVVRSDNAPQGNAQLMFVSAAQNGPRESVVADKAGHFRVNLAPGSWLVYVAGSDGNSVFHSKVDLNQNESRQMLLVGR